MHINISNATESTLIGSFMGFLWNIYIPLVKYGVIDWGAHTVGACFTGAITTLVVYQVNKHLRRRDKQPPAAPNI